MSLFSVAIFVIDGEDASIAERERSDRFLDTPKASELKAVASLPFGGRCVFSFLCARNAYDL